MNNLPKMFCITLKDTPKRTEITKLEFEKHGLNVTFFNGINGHKFGLRSSIPYMDDHPNWKPGDSSPYYMSQGHVGCVLSHYMLWQTLSYLPYEEIIIFEDDVFFVDNFVEKFRIAYAELPTDWQFAFIGHCCLPPENYQIKITNNIIKTTHPPLCTHAYMIKKSAIPTLLDTNHLCWTNIDIQLAKRTLPLIPYYVMYPPLADQKSQLKEYSDIFYTVCSKDIY